MYVHLCTSAAIGTQSEFSVALEIREAFLGAPRKLVLIII